MTDTSMEDMDDTQQERERESDDLLQRDQQGKGYGEDEGERKESLPEE